ncbi:MAG: hypothetical protein R3E01_10445 [Pirellulaceae bacterium]
MKRFSLLMFVTALQHSAFFPALAGDLTPCGCDESKHYTLQVSENGSIATNPDGSAILIEMPEPVAQEPPSNARGVSRPLALELSATEDCTTRSTGTGGRTACWSGGTILTVPPGYVSVKDDIQIAHEFRYGSENNDYVEWSDYVEVVPGTGIKLPRTLKVSVHARSGRDFGERGRTKTKFTCRFVKYTD